MGERAFQVTRRITAADGMFQSIGADPISTVVYDAKDADEARSIGAAMLNVSPADVTVEEFVASGITMAEAIKQAEALDASAESGKMMADWLREG